VNATNERYKTNLVVSIVLLMGLLCLLIFSPNAKSDRLTRIKIDGKEHFSRLDGDQINSVNYTVVFIGKPINGTSVA